MIIFICKSKMISISHISTTYNATTDPGITAIEIESEPCYSEEECMSTSPLLIEAALFFRGDIYFSYGNKN